MSERHTQQPEALRLADALRDGEYSLYQERNATEAELRRLHARVQELEFRRDIASACFRNISTASQAQRVPLSLPNAATLAASIKTRCSYAIPPYASHVIHVAIRETERAHGITQEKQG